ncbi:hypothetical protein A6V25_14685 [Nostoc sp. ATCC 53789]|nr:hypothetical protein GJB62_23010 [Nostoc sp. ATCC 53789]RCJ30347.1 hypothetical protein A6V25_14685 [Nostoc sp. ATCC 53789]
MNLLEISQKRVVWVVGFTYNQYTITGTIIKSQEKILTKVVRLRAFVSLLTGASGNVRAQSSYSGDLRDEHR